MGSGALPAVLGFGFVFWVFVGLPFSSKQYEGIPLDLVGPHGSPLSSLDAGSWAK